MGLVQFESVETNENYICLHIFQHFFPVSFFSSFYRYRIFRRFSVFIIKKRKKNMCDSCDMLIKHALGCERKNIEAKRRLRIYLVWNAFMLIFICDSNQLWTAIFDSCKIVNKPYNFTEWLKTNQLRGNKKTSHLFLDWIIITFETMDIK